MCGTSACARKTREHNVTDAAAQQMNKFAPRISRIVMDGRSVGRYTSPLVMDGYHGKVKGRFWTTCHHMDMDMVLYVKYGHTSAKYSVTGAIKQSFHALSGEWWVKWVRFMNMPSAHFTHESFMGCCVLGSCDKFWFLVFARLSETASPGGDSFSYFPCMSL